MAEKVTRVRLPALPSPELFNDPERTILTDCGGALLTYDPATRSAFIYSFETCRWNITAPVDFEVFASIVALAGYRVRDTEDARRWVESCMHGPAGAAPALH